jgi:hypothetical protein
MKHFSKPIGVAMSFAGKGKRSQNLKKLVSLARAKAPAASERKGSFFKGRMTLYQNFICSVSILLNVRHLGELRIFRRFAWSMLR